MEIFLMRHGIAEDLQPGESDHDRELTTKGIAKTGRVAISMQEKGWKFDLVLASPLVRAGQTAQILLESGLSEVLEIHPSLAPEGVLDDWLQWFQSISLPRSQKIGIGRS
jgi:phosphohistidine phosphatase